MRLEKRLEGNVSKCYLCISLGDVKGVFQLLEFFSFRKKKKKKVGFFNLNLKKNKKTLFLILFEPQVADRRAQ